MAMDFASYTDDRLSNMPESLQLRILSYLDTRHAVQTSVLSKSWVSLWTRIPVLNFTSNGFDHFVINTLSRRKSMKLDKLIFQHVGESSDEIAQKAFDYAFSHNIEDLIAKIQFIKSWPMGSSNSLTSLILWSGNAAICSLRSGLFKNLTNLHLKGVTITDLDPFAGFPELKRVKLEFCLVTTEGNVLNVHAPQLSEFTILYYYKQSINRCELTTPKLRYFEWQGSNFPQLTGCFPVLEKVVIDYNGYCREDRERVLFDDLLMLFNPLRNARSLTLFSPVVHILALFPLNGCSPPFPKLKCLTLDFKSFRNPDLFQRKCRLLMELLELVPGLEDYLLPKSRDAKCTVWVTDTIGESWKRRLMDQSGEEEKLPEKSLDMLKDESDVGCETNEVELTKAAGFRHNGSRRKNKPRRAAEVGVSV